ncbi:ComEA family DNA-binding protein [Virgibacillus proomii]|jgi:competence protein ComEA|uniref:ComEA family DNA-binding protein n=1 Tax=Virgibacillus proomii TaxID=84407 RepID=UPI00098714AA|nr:ComEA family DNA-binding protein [Virgibacillus proomii]
MYLTSKLKKVFFLIAVPLAIIIVLLLANERNQNQKESSIIINEKPKEDSTDNQSSEEASTNTSVFIDIKGEVKQPGVYEMKAQDRVIDAIKTAGGFTANADQSHVNLAQKLQDEMVIEVIANNEDSSISTTSGAATTEKININQATAEEIEELNGIGPSKAAAIIQYREENGMFKQMEDLLNVSGIGEKTLEAIQDDIQIP